MPPTPYPFREDADEWNHVIHAEGERWHWKATGTDTQHGSIPSLWTDEGFIQARTSVDALRWLVTNGPIYGYGLNFDEEFTITISPADEEA